MRKFEMALFDRSIRVEFSGVDIKQVTEKRIAFEVDKNDGLQFNHGLITIDNMPEKDRFKIARPHPLGFPMSDPVISVSLYAGYKDKEILLVTGDVLSAINAKNGPTWQTVIDVYSGLNDSTRADVQVAFSRPTNSKSIADQLLGKLGIDIKYTPEALSALQNQRVNDFATSGMADKEASIFLGRYGLSFTIEESGQGLVYVSDRPRNPQAGKTNDNTFSTGNSSDGNNTTGNGVIGTPVITRRGIDLKAYLRPRMKLFEKIFVESATTTGTLQGANYSPEYHIIGLKHIGDNRGADWFTELECVYTSLSQGNY
jgi:hypothetical protein